MTVCHPWPCRTVILVALWGEVRQSIRFLRRCCVAASSILSDGSASIVIVSTFDSAGRNGLSLLDKTLQKALESSRRRSTTQLGLPHSLRSSKMRCDSVTGWQCDVSRLSYEIC